MLLDSAAEREYIITIFFVWRNTMTKFVFAAYYFYFTDMAR